MMPKFPFFTAQQLNLDWIMQTLKKILAFMPIDKGAVGDVLQRKANGAAWEPLSAASLDIHGLQTAEAVADDDEIAIYDKTATGNRKATVAAIRASVSSPVTSVNGQTGAVVLDADDVGALADDYTPPVTSVNGQTGAVVIPTGGNVDSVNGQTGTVMLDAADVGALPDDYTPPVTSVNGQTGDVVISGGSPLDAYPVGAIYLSVNSTSPATLFGGTWEQLENRFLLGAGSDYTAGATGGEAEHALTLDEMPSHTHGSKSLVGTMNPLAWATSASESGIVTGVQQHNDRIGNAGSNFGDRKYTINATHEHDSVGGNAAHNNMPPYLVVYMWKRTA